MRTLKTALIATAATVAFASAAVAADPIGAPMAPAPAPFYDAAIFDWSGFYAGANVGYGWGDVYSGAAAADILDPQGFIAGGQIGFNLQADGIVYGIEADLQWTDISETVAAVTSELEYFGTVRGRVGFAVDQILPYLTAGLAYGHNRVSVPGVSDSELHFGWTAGGGVEVALDQNISFKAEYLYTDLGEKTYDIPGPVDAGLRFHTVRAGVNFGF